MVDATGHKGNNVIRPIVDNAKRVIEAECYIIKKILP